MGNLLQKILDAYGIIYSKGTNEKGWTNKNVVCINPKHTDKTPSAGFNFNQNKYKCFTCKITLQGVEKIIMQLEGCSKTQAFKILENKFDAKHYKIGNVVSINQEQKTKIETYFQVQWEFLESKGCYIEDNNLKIPIKIRDSILDIKYTSLTQDKIKFFSSKGAKVGLVYPFDVLLNTPKDKWVFITAGERDTLYCQALGIKAMTITGGELKLPNEMLGHYFKDRLVAVVYDNDEGGKVGAIKLANWLLRQGAKQVKNITAHHLVCEENGGDIFDYFTKYQKTIKDFGKIFTDTTPFNYKKTFSFDAPFRELGDALKNGGHYAWYKGSGIIRAREEKKNILTTYALLQSKDETRRFYLDLRGVENLQEALKFCGSQKANKEKLMRMFLKEELLDDKGKPLKTLPHKDWDYIPIETKTLQVVYITTSNKLNKMIEVKAMVKEGDIILGGEYEFVYNITTMPFVKENVVDPELIVLIGEKGELKSNLNNFKLDNKTKLRLSKFSQLTSNTSVEEGWKRLFDNFALNAGLETDYELFTIYELTYHSALKLPYDKARKISLRGVLHSLVVGESGIGKTKITEQMQKWYGAGVKVDLQNTTAKALVGGSQKSANGSYKTVIGVLPTQHKKLVILEELQRADKSFHTQIAEARASGEINIFRVSGGISAECLVRQIENANQIQDKPISHYNNGVEILKSLIPGFQDIRRYDVFLIKGPKEQKPEHFKDNGKKSIFTKLDYTNRLAWAWTRESEDIKITPQAQDKAMEMHNFFRKKYNFRFNIFGNETIDKILRLAIAVAIALVSTDPTFSQVIVKKEHIEFVCNFIESIYTNDVFKLDIYAAEEKKYVIEKEEDVNIMKYVFNTSPEIINSLFKRGSCPKQELRLSAALEGYQTFSDCINFLTNHHLAREDGKNITPSHKFREIYKRELDYFVQEFENVKKSRLRKLDNQNVEMN